MSDIVRLSTLLFVLFISVFTDSYNQRASAIEPEANLDSNTTTGSGVELTAYESMQLERRDKNTKKKFRRPRFSNKPHRRGQFPVVEPIPVEPLPSASISDSTVHEGNSGTSELQFTVTLDAPANGFVNVNYTTTDGSATAEDNDYVPVNGMLTIDPGFTSTVVVIGIRGDNTPESDETVTLTLSQPTSNVTLEQRVATGTIINDDQPEEIQQSLPDLPRGIISTSGKRLRISQNILENSTITGFMVVEGWNEVEIAEGIYDWSHIDSEVARAKAAGKVVRLSIHIGGDDTPQWLSQNYPEIKNVIWYDKRSGSAMSIPAYWDSKFIEVRRRFFEAVGNRYQNEPTIFAVSGSMVNPNTGDWTFAAQTTEQVQSYLDAGFTEEVFIDAHKRVLDYAMAAFKNKYVISAVGPIPRELVSDKYSAVYKALDYAYATYSNRLIIIKGSLSSGTPSASVVPENHHWQTIRKYSPNASAQFVWSVTDDPDFKMNGKVPYAVNQNKDIFWNAVQIGKSYNLRWIEVWSIDLLNPDLQDDIRAAALLFSSD